MTFQSLFVLQWSGEFVVPLHRQKVRNNMVKIQEIEVKSVMTKSNLPVADFSVNPYVGCLYGGGELFLPRGDSE